MRATASLRASPYAPHNKRLRRHGGDIRVIRKGFPSDEAPATRLVIAAGLQGHDVLAFAHELGRGLWELEKTLSDPIDIGDAATRSGLDLAKVRAAAPPDSELEAIWDRNTAEGLARGVFGAPAYVLPSGEIFWGQDRLEFLDRALSKM